MVLKNKVALVTGAAAGIGQGIAHLFASQGAKVFLLDRDGARNDASAQAIKDEFGFARAHVADVTDAAAIATAVGAAHA